MDVVKFTDIPITKFGNQLEIAGMLLSGDGGLHVVPFAGEDTQQMKLIEMTPQNWVDLVAQLDTLNTEMFPNDKSTPVKALVRKSQRQIEQGVSWKVFKRDHYHCRYCGNDDTPLTVDHIVLWEDLGASVQSNLITACKKCNKTRGNMNFLDWLKTSYCKSVMEKYAEQKHIEVGYLTAKTMYNILLSDFEAMYERAVELPKRAQQRSR